MSVVIDKVYVNYFNVILNFFYQMNEKNFGVCFVLLLFYLCGIKEDLLFFKWQKRMFMNKVFKEFIDNLVCIFIILVQYFFDFFCNIYI